MSMSCGRVLWACLVDISSTCNYHVPFPSAVNFERIRTLMAQGQGVDVEEVKLMLIGMCHDLRGIVSVFNSRVPYLMLFEWMYPKQHCLKLIKSIKLTVWPQILVRICVCHVT